MTDTNGATDVGNPVVGDDTGDQGQPPVSEGLFTELDDATREWVTSRHGDDVTKLAKQAYELDKFAGSAVRVPKDGATDEEVAEFYTKIGRPKDAASYELAVPDQMPETMPYNSEMADKFREAAFAQGLSAKQATTLHDWFVGEQIGLAKAFQGSSADQLAETIGQANEALQKAWGTPDGETYKANLELAGKFFNSVDEDGGLRERLAKVGLVGPDNEILVPELAFAFAKAGAAIWTEGGTLDMGDGHGLNGANPFEEGSVNLTKIMALVKADPDKARLMAKAAGVENLADYGLN